MRRREFIKLLSSRSSMAADRASAAGGAAGNWLPRREVARGDGIRLRAFHGGLKETGFVDGDNVSILYRFAENQTDRLARLAADLVQRNATVIATAGPSAAAVNASCLAFSFLRHHLGRLSFFDPLGGGPPSAASDPF